MILKPLLGSDLLLAPQVQRLFAQSYIIATAELEQYGSAKSREPIELHPAERDSRRNALEKKLTGFDVRGLREPSSADRRSGLHAPTAVCVESEGMTILTLLYVVDSFLTVLSKLALNLVFPFLVLWTLKLLVILFEFVPQQFRMQMLAQSLRRTPTLLVLFVFMTLSLLQNDVFPLAFHLRAQTRRPLSRVLLILRPKSLQQLAMMICSLSARSSIWSALAPFCLEIFKGSCRLTRTMHSAGFNARAVDF